MLSQFFILTSRGDTIVSKDFRGDVVKGAQEIFFRKLKTWVEQPPPIFNVEGIHFAHIKKNGLYFVCTTKFNVAPSMVIELLTRIAGLLKDYCGVLTEESIRVNFVLAYELLDEAIDFGYAQTTSTEVLKSFVYNQPIALLQDAKDSQTNQNTASSSAPNKPIALRLTDEKDRKNEIFVDLLERMTVLVAPNGSIIRAEVDGSIQMKSFLAGTPDLRMGLNEDIVIGRGTSAYGVVLDDCNFHESVQLTEFEQSRTLILRPPDGEFTVMNYRISDARSVVPFMAQVVVEKDPSPGRFDVIVKVESRYPARVHAANVVVRVPLPKSTTSCSYEGTPGHKCEYKKEEKAAYWTIPKAVGSSTYYMRLKLIGGEDSDKGVLADLGPLTLDFELPMYLTSGISIKHLRVFDRGRFYVPCRWVRYITKSNSYVIRVSKKAE